MPEMRVALAAALLLLGACAVGGEAGGLVGRDWRLVAFDSSPVAAPNRSTLHIAADGKVSGDGGCNRYSSQAKLEEHAIGFGAVLATRRACEPEVTRQEVRLFEGLSRTRSWRLEGGELLLRDDEGREVLRFAP